MQRSLTVWVMFLVAGSVSSRAQDGNPERTVRIEHGDLSVLFRDNSNSPAVLSGIDALFHVKRAPDFDAFDPDTAGASAGLNFEHIISGHESPHNQFTPRRGRYSLYALPDKKSVKLVRRAEDSPWKVDSTLTYTVEEPHYIDFEFRCTPRDEALFGEHGSAIFFFANYMNDVTDAALHFRGRTSADDAERWISADAPKGHRDWNGGGNYRSLPAHDLANDDDVQFRLNSWTYDWPRFAKPFYYGRADHGMTMILMFDRISSERDQIRFSLYKFKLPKHPRPAWDFQYVVNRVRTDETYGFRGRLVWKQFVSAEDCLHEYDQWNQLLLADHVRQLRDCGATVFLQDGLVTEVSANGTTITDEQLDLVSSFTEMTDLSLESTRITDVGIAHLSNMHKLEWLNLYHCSVGDEYLGTLAKLKSLQHLPIGSSNVTDAGLIHIARMRQLQYLGLRDNHVTDEGLKHLTELTNLTGLHLGETKVTDKGIAHLSGMRNLKQLWLHDTRVSDAAIPTLAMLPSLQALYVQDTQITLDGIKRLRKSLPGCRVVGTAGD